VLLRPHRHRDIEQGGDAAVVEQLSQRRSELRARRIRSVYYNGSPFTARFELRRFRVAAY
jgi:hypothetical protein